MREMSAGELKEYLDAATEKPILLDVREAWEFDIARLENAQLIPMRTIPGKLSELDPDQETVVICHHGIRSRQVCRFLENEGFSRLINLSGGVEEWAREVDNQMATY
ncbi:MAG: rhodanese-like domain-containing protein [Gammaproteobacteria bacterium]